MMVISTHTLKFCALTYTFVSARKQKIHPLLNINYSLCIYDMFTYDTEKNCYSFLYTFTFYVYTYVHIQRFDVFMCSVFCRTFGETTTDTLTLLIFYMYSYKMIIQHYSYEK